MSSPYPVASLLGTLLFLVRHEPHATEHHTSLLAALRAVRDRRDLRLEAGVEGLRINDQTAALDSPGTALVSEQMLLHGIRGMILPMAIGDEDLLRLLRVLSAFPGTYPGYSDVVRALGETATRITLTRVTSEFEVFRSMPWRPRSPADGEPPVDRGQVDMPEIRVEAAATFERIEEIELGGGTQDADLTPMVSGGTPTSPRPALDELIRRGREALGRSDWDGLLDVALAMLEGESEAPSELTGSSFRIELRRLLSRKELVELAGFAHGDRRQEAITVLRRFGTEATEILMALLIEAATISERRGYYSAITQLSHGTDAVVYHLSHPQWFVVRNAADLCGELSLAEAVPELVRQSDHEDERVRKAIAEALGRIGTPQAMEGLRKILNDPAQAVRLKALTHLGGRQARGMVSALRKLLQREEVEAVLHEALVALGRIGSPDAVALLGEWAAPGGILLGRKPAATRLAAVRGLALAGPAALDALTTLQRDDSPDLRQAASRAIDALKP